MKTMKMLALTLLVSTPVFADNTVYDKIIMPIYIPVEMCLPTISRKDVIINCVTRQKEVKEPTSDLGKQ